MKSSNVVAAFLCDSAASEKFIILAFINIRLILQPINILNWFFSLASSQLHLDRSSRNYNLGFKPP